MSIKSFLKTIFPEKQIISHSCHPDLIDHIPQLSTVTYHYDCRTDMYLMQAFMPAELVEPILDDPFTTRFALDVDKKLLRETKDSFVRKLLAH